MAKAEFAKVIPVLPGVVLTLSDEEARWLTNLLAEQSGFGPAFPIYEALHGATGY